jgi:hypothetical protein
MVSNWSDERGSAGSCKLTLNEAFGVTKRRDLLFGELEAIEAGRLLTKVPLLGSLGD